MDAVIRCDPLDGQWQTLGTERYRGIVAENIEASANAWGPDQLSFNVKAVEPGAIRPDLLPYTPVELEIDGTLVWAGRVRQRPSTDHDHAVTCEGWQYHLDDDAYNRVYVHTRLGDYRDQRTFLGADLTKFTVSGAASVDNGVLTIGWPNGAVVPAGGCVGVTLDLGPDSTAKRVVLTWESTNNSGTVNAAVRGSSGENPLTALSFDDAIVFAMNTGLSGSTAGTLATARRYIHVFLVWAGGGTLAADLHLRVTGLKTFRLVAYESGKASVLRADTVIKDALTLAPLLNQTTSLIQAGTFDIPEFLTNDYQPPREPIDAVNAFENRRLKIGGTDLKTLVFDDKPAAPIVEVGNWSGAQFADSSVAGEDIYDQVFVTGTGPDGAILVRSWGQTGTLVDRNGFHRTKVLPIRTAGTASVYDRFGLLWLGDHKRAPFAGKLSATSGIRRVQGGATVPAHEMLLYAGERIRLSHRIDPDTGAQARDGVIAGISYSHDARQVELDIDDRRDHFESILERYSVLVDQFLN